MIAPQRDPRPAISLPPRRYLRRGSVVRSAHVAPWKKPAPTLWEIFLDDRRALGLKWSLLILLLVVAALLDLPL